MQRPDRAHCLGRRPKRAPHVVPAPAALAVAALAALTVAALTASSVRAANRGRGAGAGAGDGGSSAWATAPAESAALFPPFAHAPLDLPAVITGTFGEYRIGHFHAGLDYSTDETVGHPVYAPLAGVVERVRASGVGYGRSLYLRAADGRLIVLAHLDAFDQPVASYVEAVQDSTGQYEQDLWPPAGRFRVAAGQRVGWSGRSGTGDPHLHLEVRRGDMAIHPLRAGAATVSVASPRLARVTLEPLDDTSLVERGRRPRTASLGAAPETLRAFGRLRLVVEAQEVSPRSSFLVPWSVRMEDGTEWVECRYDSVSWAGDMPEVDAVFDRGRVTAHGRTSIALWAPAGFRPRVLHASAPDSLEAGTLAVRAGDPPRVVVLRARDLGGATAVARLVLAPEPRRVALLEVGSPGPSALGQVLDQDGPGFRHADDPGAPSGDHRQADLFRAGPATAASGKLGSFGWMIPRGALFWPGRLAAEEAAAGAGSGELKPVSARYALHPFLFPLRSAATLRIALPPGVSARHVGLYRDGGAGWELVPAAFDSARRELVGDSRRLGGFALLRDDSAPRIALRAPARPQPSAAYSRWALEATVEERGSGVDARASGFVVDGRRRPSEWDAERRVLRWRPLRAPSPGTHRVTVRVADKAGNLARVRGRFVID